MAKAVLVPVLREDSYGSEGADALLRATVLMSRGDSTRAG
jgi:hypothetical protein